MPQSSRRNAPSAGISSPCGPREQPVSIGFIAPARRPNCRRASASAPAATVFPTPVSVPVTNIPLFISSNPA